MWVLGDQPAYECGTACLLHELVIGLSAEGETRAREGEDACGKGR